MAAKKSKQNRKVTAKNKIKTKGSGEKQSKSAKRTAPAGTGDLPNDDTLINACGPLQFPVVVIGASAGGLDAFKKFFSNMPADSGIGFVLVPHLDPTHRSLMVELLAKQTQMRVHEAKNGMTIQANSVYVIPPNKYLAISNGKIQLSVPTERRGLQTAIDFCFRSLAADQQEKAIAIILSGTASHGTSGLKEVKLAGGMVMVQEPASAEYDQMPRSAIATGQVDYILPPEKMPDALVKYIQHPYLNGAIHESPAATEPQHLNRILAVLKTRMKYDFRCYRNNMLMRRVQRRMGLSHIQEMPDYVEYLRENPKEATALYRDLLIGVTAFFRESEAFQVLQQRVVPELVERTKSDIPVRVWVPGCATGEEAYSVAMLLIEQFGEAQKPLNLQIFATDIDEQSLETARHGIYPDSIATDLSAERLRRFFVVTDESHYQVNKQLRESIVFAPQNLISDAPFSKLDLVSCRNLLIYLEPDVQAKVIRLFHFALVDDGYLLLGPSESIGRQVDLFEPLSKKWRVYRRIGSVRRDLVDIPIVATDERRAAIPRAEPTPAPAIGFNDLTKKLVLDDFAPATALVNRKYEILSVLGPLVNYLEFPPGEITQDLLAMARQGLRTKLRAAVHKVVRDGETMTDRDARVKRNGTYIPCTITVKPIVEPKGAEGLLLVTFEDRDMVGRLTKPSSEAPDERPAEDEESQIVHQLEYELKTTREDLQSTIEEMESSNEELKASNEEVMSMNEELQSANEELETSKEELQSLNEELSTVNHQLEDKVEELDNANNDMTNLIANTDISIVFLDTKLCIQRFTPPTAKLLNLMATDVGRPFRDFSPKFSDEALLDDCQQVLERLTPIEAELTTDDDRCYLRRILPYRTADKRIEGVVVAFVDITERTKAEAESRRLATAMRDSNDAVTVQSLDGRIIDWNRGAERMYGHTEAEALTMNIRDLVPEALRDQALATVGQIAQGMESESFETQRLTKDGRTLDIWLTVSKLVDEAGRVAAIATTERDVTARKKSEAALRTLNEKLEQSVAEQTSEVRLLAEAVSHLGEGVMITSDKLDWPGPQIVFVNQAMCRITGYAMEELIGQTPRILQGNDTNRATLDRIKSELADNRSCLVELKNHRKDGTAYDAELFITPLINAEGRRTNFVSIHRDITERKEADRALLHREREFRALADNVPALFAYIGKDLRYRFVNKAYQGMLQPPVDDIVGQHVKDIVGPEAWEIIRPRIEAALRGETVKFEVQLPVSRGQPRWFNATYVPNYDGTELDGIFVLVLEITERKEAEQLLRESEEKVRAIVKTATDAIITIGEDGVIRAANPATKKMFGYSVDETLGHNVNILMPSPFREEHDGYIASYLKTGVAKIIGIGRELTGRRKDGTTFPIDVAVSRHYDQNEWLFTGVIRDISERMQLQRDVLHIAEDEQRRIGQDLHDSVQQELAGLGMLAQTLLDNLANASSGLDERGTRQTSELVTKIVNGIASTQQEVQTISRGLVPLRLDSQGLMDALHELAARTDGLEGVSCAFKCEEPVEIEDGVTATHLYRIAQEAITNSLKHGRPEHILIALETDDGRPMLQVADDGTGFDSTQDNGGMGLKTMLYRASLIGASVSLKPVDAGGTLVTCRISEK